MTDTLLNSKQPAYVEAALNNVLDTLSLDGDAGSQLIALVGVLRPRDADDGALAAERFGTLCNIIEHDESRRLALRSCLLRLFADRKQVSFFADSGILPNSGFFSELWRRIVHRIFPAITDPDSLKDCVNLIFHRRDDHVWLEAIPVDLKLRFWQALGMSANDGIEAGEPQGERTGELNGESQGEPNGELKGKHGGQQAVLLDSILQMLSACDVLAIRIGAMGLEPELARLSPRIEERDSPFVALSCEAQQLSTAYRKYLGEGESPVEDERQLMVLIDQCREVIVRVRARAASIGTSLSLTYLLWRLEQSLRRLEIMVRMLSMRHQVAVVSSGAGLDTTPSDNQTLPALWVDFLGHAVQGEGQRQSIREHISRTIGLLALRVTENASRTGEHYITATREEYLQMWRSAMGAGFIVGFMSLLKVYSSLAPLAPLGFFAAYSLNYAFGFMLIHVLHLTLATKQPAMTASTIAGAIGEIRGRMRDVEKLATLVVDLIRSQIAAILGNVFIAIPTAILISFVVARISGQPLMSAEKAHKLIHELSPFNSLALFHAAIAGVCLFIAGLISGYYDNLAAYERIRERIEHTQWLRALLGPTRLSRFAVYLDDNLGALAGNFFLGVMLALVGTIGFMTGLPIDVRHVTLSSANFGLAWASLEFAVDAATVGETLLGIALVGLVNLLVSFALALWVAMRARGVGFSQTRMLAGILLRRFSSSPRQFFWPTQNLVSDTNKHP